MSTVEKGNKFRDEVGSLLRSANYEVHTEILIGSKRVDLLIIKKDLGKLVRTSVECKAYSGTLTRVQISNIYGDLSSLLESRLIDKILLVTTGNLSPSAQAYIYEQKNMSHLTFQQLQNSLMDFSKYLADMIYLYDEEQISSFYYDARTTEGGTLEEAVGNWMVFEEAPPIAILASYGMGKTTFARHLAVRLARAVLAGETSRIPVYIPLGEISSEQSLEGLLGRVLSAKSVVENYHFSTFMKLNEMGRLLLILDGFDEMKHAMTWEQFKYNFSELNRLVGPLAKVILLGRPSAFLSDEEYVWVLRGERILGSQNVTMRDWPSYQEFHIAPLDKEGSLAFLDRYLNNRPIRGRKHVRSPAGIRASIAAISHKQFNEILARPVHVKMLAEISADGEMAVDKLSIVNLYASFVDLTIEREMEKHTRRLFSAAERRLFARELAWWMWTENAGMNISIEGIPNSLFIRYRKTPDMDLDGISRDLTSACFLDRKLGGKLYFPHRSFQEFLVAEKLSIVDSDRIDYANITKTINPEIVRFLDELGTDKLKYRWIESLAGYSGAVTFPILDFLSNTGGELSPGQGGAWFPLLLVCRATGEKSFNNSGRLFASLLSTFRQVPRLDARQVILVAALVAGDRLRGKDRTSVDNLFGAMLLSSFAIRQPMLNPLAERAFFLENKNNPLLHTLASAMTIEREKESKSMKFSIDSFKFLQLSQREGTNFVVHNIQSILAHRVVRFDISGIKSYCDHARWELIRDYFLTHMNLGISYNVWLRDERARLGSR